MNKTKEKILEKARIRRRETYYNNIDIERKKLRDYYYKNKEKALKNRKQYYQVNKERLKPLFKEYKIKNKDYLKQKEKERYMKNREHEILMRKQYYKRTYNVLRFEALTYYGGGIAKCVCCNEQNLRFLTLDHINNDGKDYRRKTGTTIFRWLKTNNYPVGFQTLCFNCNCGRALNQGICPHKQNSIKSKQNLPPIHIGWSGVV